MSAESSQGKCNYMQCSSITLVSRYVKENNLAPGVQEGQGLL